MKRFLIVLINQDDNTVVAVCGNDDYELFTTEIEAVGIGSEMTEKLPGVYSLVFPLDSFERLLQNQESEPATRGPVPCMRVQRKPDRRSPRDSLTHQDGNAWDRGLPHRHQGKECLLNGNNASIMTT